MFLFLLSQCPGTYCLALPGAASEFVVGNVLSVEGLMKSGKGEVDRTSL